MGFSIKKIKLNHLLKFFIFSTFTLFLLFMAKKYFDQSASFAFVDEYDNIAAADQMIKGKKLFTEVFHNRQIGPVYLSYLIQTFSKPQTLYQLIVVHRLFVIAFSFSFSMLLLFRFGLIGLGFSLLFEPIKYYFHGNLFLAESFIIYPLVYLVLLLFEKKKKLSYIDMILTGIFTWFMIFSREPYVPLALLLFISIFIKQKDLKGLIYSSIIVFLLSTISLNGLNLKDYFFQLYTVNKSRISGNSFDNMDNINLFSSLFYPVLMFKGGAWNHFRFILSLYSASLIIFSSYLIIVLSKYRLVLVTLLILTFSAIRVISPGTVYYGAYRMMIWNGLLIASLLIFLNTIIETKKNFLAPFIMLILIFIVSFYPKESFIFRKVNKAQSFNINYNRYFVNGEAIKLLAEKGDTLFVDGYDSLLFWQAGIPSAYKYAFYYPIMKNIKIFDDAKKDMFERTPPTFYFVDCIYRNINPIPKEISANYKQFIYTVINEETCLYINKNKIKKISEEKIKLIEKYNYRLEEN